MTEELALKKKAFEDQMRAREEAWLEEVDSKTREVFVSTSEELCVDGKRRALLRQRRSNEKRQTRHAHVSR